MNVKHIYPTLFFALLILTGACTNEELQEQAQNQEEHATETENENEELQTVHLSELKFTSLGIKVDSLPKRTLSDIIKANGQLKVPPQHEATITPVLGANVVSIEVIEGDFVTKEQPIAYLSHPNLIRVQTEYIKSWRQMNYLEREYGRQKKLYEEEIGSGQQYQQTEAEYESIRAEVLGYEAHLKQLNMNAQEIRGGTIYERIPVISPINGYVEDVGIQIGQYVDPQTTLFEIINNEHIHADLMVFEKDVYQVKKDQQISFTVQSIPGSRLTGKIYSVGKQFEENPKAVHVHAEIDSKEGFLIPGMYINGSIYTDSKSVYALPEDAIIQEDNKSYMFEAERHEENGEIEWEFRPIEIITGLTLDGWVEVKLLDPLPEGTEVVWNNAYYLISEMKKGETGHDD